MSALGPRRTRANAAALPRLGDRYAAGTGGLQVSPICLGLVKDPNTISEAFDAGINFFFVSADMHWPLYEGVRRGLAALFERGGGVRDDVVVAAVSYVTQREFTFAPFLEVIESVPGLERLDLTIIGGAYADDLLVRLQEYAKHLEGRVPGVRALGATFHDRRACALAARRGLVDTAFVRYNPSHPGAEHDVLPHVRGAPSTLLYGFKSTSGFRTEERLTELGLARDDWRPDVTDYYRWALRSPELDGILCALSVPDHVRALDAALARGPLDDDEVQYLRDLADLDEGRATLESR